MLMKRCDISYGRIILPFCIFCLFGFGLASNNGVSADDSVVDLINITVPTSCSFAETVDDNNVYTATVRNNEYEDDIGHTTFKVFCNDKDGYSIYAVGYSNNTFGNTEMVYQGSANPAPSNIVTGTATSGSTSNWAMKMNAVAGTYAPTLVNGFGSYRTVPSAYTKVATFPSQTDNNTGSSVQSSYAVFVSPTQPAGTYEGKVRYTLVHPNDDTPAQPVACTAGKICYNANGGNVVGTMGQQSTDDSDNNIGNGSTVTLLASNFSREGYGFAGWSTTYDYSDPNGFYGPNETITTPNGTATDGLALYAYWVESTGALQGWTCPNNTNMPIGTVTALTDFRDNDTYAVAKLADGKCWMIENLRLDNTASHNSDGALAQGYGGVFAGLANPEQPWGSNSDAANSLYYSGIQSGTASINIGTEDPGIRFPRYNNQNTASRATNPTSDGNLYGYGNYYTWPVAIANTDRQSLSNDNTLGTSICPSGWYLPTGGRVNSSEGAAIANVTGDVSTFRDYYYLGYTIMGSNITAYEDSPNGGAAFYSNNTINALGDTAIKAFRRYPNNFVFSGYVFGGTIGNRGSYSGLWSSTSYNGGNGYVMYLNNEAASPGTVRSGKYCGWTVRCIANSP